MEKKQFTIEYDINLELEALYTFLDAIYDKNHFNYPKDIQDLLKLLLQAVAKYTNHEYKNYDILKEENYKKITYCEKCD